MTNLDSLLDTLKAAPAPEGLAAIETGVFAGVALQRERALARRGLALAGAISLAIGFSASLIPTHEARSVPIFGIPSDAPSHLLAG